MMRSPQPFDESFKGRHRTVLQHEYRTLGMTYCCEVPRRTQEFRPSYVACFEARAGACTQEVGHSVLFRCRCNSCDADIGDEC